MAIFFALIVGAIVGFVLATYFHNDIIEAEEAAKNEALAEVGALETELAKLRSKL